MHPMCAPNRMLRAFRYAESNTMNRLAIVLILSCIVGLTGLLIARLAATAPREERVLGAYSTSLRGRTRHQRHNAELAARSLNHHSIKPGAIFSFNRTVKSWTVDQGYVKALVSYDGELVRAYGGGVCQSSTTLYNAALLAGLPIVERHPHVRVPGYIAPGRDAAVAYPGIDLRFRNPHPYPLRLEAAVRGDRLEVRLIGIGHSMSSSSDSVAITSKVLSRTEPSRLTISTPRRTSRRVAVHSPGSFGYRVMTQRVFFRKGREVRRERLSDDSYPSMNRVIALAP